MSSTSKTGRSALTYTPMDWDATDGRTRTWFARSARHAVSEIKAGLLHQALVPLRGNLDEECRRVDDASLDRVYTRLGFLGVLPE
jgi:hypothetical protein